MNRPKITRERPLIGKRQALGPARRWAVAEHRLQPAAAPADPTLIPALVGVCTSARVCLGQDPAKYTAAAVALVKFHGDYDAPTPNDQQRQQLQAPQAAGACVVAAEQARQLEDPASQAVAAASPVKAEELQDACGKHTQTIGSAEAVRQIVVGAGDCCLVAGGARGLMRDYLLGWYQKQVAAAAPGSERLVALRATFGPALVLHDKIVARYQGQQRQVAQDRNEALDRLDQAESDLGLAQVLNDMRAGKEVPIEDQLAAARHLRAQQEAAGAPAPAAAASKRRSQKR